MSSDETLKINEIFVSIQGESTYVGCPCTFIRLRGCHLRCNYCDTSYAFREGYTRSLDSIIDEVMLTAPPLVEVTGGEPLLQKPVFKLMKTLCDLDKKVLLETSGACSTKYVDDRVSIILDVKTPGSGELDRVDWDNLTRIRKVDEVKFVILNEEDYKFSCQVIKEYKLVSRSKAVLFSPVFDQKEGIDILGAEGLPPEKLAAWILRDNVPVRLQLQMHKYIWDPNKRGV